MRFNCPHCMAELHTPDDIPEQQLVDMTTNCDQCGAWLQFRVTLVDFNQMIHREEVDAEDGTLVIV